MSTFFYMLLAFIVGILVGWFFWGRLRGELDSLRGDLDRTKSERDRLRADTNRLSGELDACSRARADLEGRLREAPSTPAKTGANKAAAPAPTALMSTPAEAKSSPAKSAAAKPAAAKPAAQPKPAAKSAAPKASAAPKKAPAPKKAAAPKAAAGKGDNLRRLIGIGPVNEKLLKGQGVTTYAQIAAWTEADVKRIEDVLNFDGRIAREKWIEQAKLLAAGDEKEFARRFPTAGTASNT
ncbi:MULTISPECIES: proton-conducting membrane transporter [unclassified Mesorhizobium]|uniref:proton-conducting membrane transporter n=1 Tax=unclassified Mesorhizobium TaxID=325217 RepID=UPI000F75F376|nr:MULTISPECIES: proton-conducting membrane transporter [unclassified Mesorhizobium]AZO21946.1 proton-conducting membrane transporter [Mesorhizobium sp. M1E.F.Ca.ET.045.02.1.1]RUW29309.1 proton-conducting membrane transporter [Mesorhizobium sp. M1E.F.Ca.ET.041.01.1.1]RUW68638.1 proton-conducting membrane transporter [Mesorhizobium sp. M1E.F.Ca.ET.063.01.1.1]RWD90459.1 MAG: proton-conducting membrane transporter [Mesorhizobium sp.]RWD93602.1 MAG: proton-conducting membrane transporter [Mesorhiz